MRDGDARRPLRDGDAGVDGDARQTIEHARRAVPGGAVEALGALLSCLDRSASWIGRGLQARCLGELLGALSSSHELGVESRRLCGKRGALGGGLSLRDRVLCLRPSAIEIRDGPLGGSGLVQCLGSVMRFRGLFVELLLRRLEALGLSIRLRFFLAATRDCNREPRNDEPE